MALWFVFINHYQFLDHTILEHTVLLTVLRDHSWRLWRPYRVPGNHIQVGHVYCTIWLIYLLIFIYYFGGSNFLANYVISEKIQSGKGPNYILIY